MNPLVWITAAMLAAAAPTPSRSVTIETPEQQRLRSVSPEEVQQAYERLMREENPAQITPAPPPASQPAANPPIIELEFRPNESAPLAVPLTRAAAAPSAPTPPAWKPAWEEKKLFSGRESRLQIDYAWKDLVAAVELRPSSSAGAPIRVLFHRPASEPLLAQPGETYELTILARRKDESAWERLYHAEGQVFKTGCLHRLEIPAALEEDVTAFLAQAASRRAAPLATPTPMVLTVTPLPAVGAER